MMRLGVIGSNPYFSADSGKPSKRNFAGFFVLLDITSIEGLLCNSKKTFFSPITPKSSPIVSPS